MAMAIGLQVYGQATSENQSGQATDSVIGYAWAKTPLSAKQILTVPFKPLKHNGVYQSLGKTADGLLIVCELTSGQKALALMPFKDGMGYKIVIRNLETNQVSISHPLLDRLDSVKLKPADVTLELGRRYDVVDRSDDRLTLISPVEDFRPTVEVESTDVEFVSLADVPKEKVAIIDGLRSAANNRLRKLTFNSSESFVTDEILEYTGKLSGETVNERQHLATEYVEKYSRVMKEIWEADRIKAQQEKKAFEASQKAKGLLEFRGEWVTTEVKKAKIDEETEQEVVRIKTLQALEAVRIKNQQILEEVRIKAQQEQEAYEASQKAKRNVKYQGEWLSPEAYWAKKLTDIKLEAEANARREFLNTKRIQGFIEYQGEWLTSDQVSAKLEAEATAASSQRIAEWNRTHAPEATSSQPSYTPSYVLSYDQWQANGKPVSSENNSFSRQPSGPQKQIFYDKNGWATGHSEYSRDINGLDKKVYYDKNGWFTGHSESDGNTTKFYDKNGWATGKSENQQ